MSLVRMGAAGTGCYDETGAPVACDPSIYGADINDWIASAPDVSDSATAAWIAGGRVGPAPDAAMSPAAQAAAPATFSVIDWLTTGDGHASSKAAAAAAPAATADDGFAYANQGPGYTAGQVTIGGGSSAPSRSSGGGGALTYTNQGPDYTASQVTIGSPSSGVPKWVWVAGLLGVAGFASYMALGGHLPGGR